MRTPVEKRDVGEVVAMVFARVHAAREKHGHGAYASHHEWLGVLVEEFVEFLVAVWKHEDEQVIDEALDVAQVMVFGIAGMLAKARAKQGEEEG